MGSEPTTTLTEVLLPSGARVRGHLPTLGTLVRRNLLPSDLLGIALKAANPAWLAASRALGDEDAADARRYLNVLVAAFPRERDDGAGWVPWRLTPEQLTDDSVDELEIDALENVVLRFITPEELSASSAMLLGLPAPDAGEVPAGIAGWGEFRGEPDGGASSGDGPPLEPTTQQSARGRGSRGGVRARRGAGDGG